MLSVLLLKWRNMDLKGLLGGKVLCGDYLTFYGSINTQNTTQPSAGSLWQPAAPGAGGKVWVLPSPGCQYQRLGKVRQRLGSILCLGIRISHHRQGMKLTATQARAL